MPKVGSLLITIEAGVAKLQEGMASATKLIETSVDSMKDKMLEFGGALAGAFAIERLAEFGKQTVETAANLSHMAEKTGSSVESLSVLGHAAKMSGASMEDVASAMEGMNRKMVLAAEGSAKGAKGFDALGVSVKNQDGTLKSNDQILGDIADKFQAMPDGAAKAGLAVQIFGGAGTKMIPILNGGREGLKKFKEEAESLGIVMDERTAEGARNLENDVKKMGEEVQGAANHILEQLLPSLNMLTEKFVDMGKADNTNGAVGAVLTGFRLIETAGIRISSMFERVGKSFGALAAGANSLMHGDFDEFVAIGKMSQREIDGLYDQMQKDIDKVWADPPKPDLFVGPIDVAGTHVKDLGNNAEKTAKKMEEAANQMVDALAKVAELKAKDANNGKGDKAAELDAQFQREIGHIQDKLKFEKLTDDQRAALTKELAQLQISREKEVSDAEIKMAYDDAEKKEQLDIDLEKARAKGTKTKLDDLAAEQHQERLNLEKHLRDMNATVQMAEAQRTALAAAQSQQRVLLEQEEAEKSSKAQMKSYDQLATQLSDVSTKMIFSPMQAGFKGIASLVDIVGKELEKLIQDMITSGIEKMFMNILGVVAAPATGGASLGGLLLSGLGFAQGGYTGDGPDTKGDKKLAMLSDQEFVVNAEGTKKAGLGLLNWLNGTGSMGGSHGIPAFASGGMMGGGGPGGGITIAPVAMVQASSTLMHRDILERELGPVLRKMTFEQMDSIIRQLKLTPNDVSRRG